MTKKSGHSTLPQQAPSFAEAFEAAAFFAAVGIEPEIFAVRELDGNDVPEIERDDVGDDDVNFFGGERNHFFFDVDVGVDGVSAMALIGGRADLHAPEALAGVENEVVAVRVSTPSRENRACWGPRLSPQGLATPKPRLMALRIKASSAISPRRLGG